MARNNMAGNAVPRQGSGEIRGFLLVAGAVMLLAALLSFDPYDTAFSRYPANEAKSNWIGPMGAYLAHALYFVFGLPALILAGAMALFGASYFWSALEHIRGRWPWLIGFMVACMGLFHLYEPIFDFKDSMDITSPGGLVGEYLNVLLIERFLGQIGGTFVFGCLYLMSLVYVADIDVMALAREYLDRRQEAKLARMTEEEKIQHKVEALEREAQEIERKLNPFEAPKEKPARGRRGRKKVDPEPELEAEPEATAKEMADIATPLGADLQPVPEPTVRDLSERERRKADEEPELPEEADEEIEEDDEASAEAEAETEADEVETEELTAGDVAGKEQEVQEGETITAREVGAATTEELLGKATLGDGNLTVDDDEATEGEAGNEDSKEAEESASEEETAAPEGDSGDDEAKAEDSAAEAAPAEAEKPPAPVPGPKKPTLSSLRGRMVPRNPKRIEVAQTPKIAKYKRPGSEFMYESDAPVKRGETKEELMANAKLMQDTLKQFGIEVSLGDITKGPTITRYELHPAPGIKLEKIAALSNNLTATLKAERINILAPVPGKSSVGIEVPNRVKTKVVMRDLLESPEWKKSKARIPLALGKDVYGKPIVADLADMPHLLIAGSTGSGKSVCINSIVASLLTKFAPDEMRFVMIDPKVVELQQYNVLPHLVVPVVTDPKKVVMALRWVITEMEKRYQIFAKVGVRNVHSFNNRNKGKKKKKKEDQFELRLDGKGESDGFAVELDEEMVANDDEQILIPDRLSYVTVIIDELADLMIMAPKETEEAIARITQMARAAGIHCIVATQRPSVDVITGLIKANIPSRIAFQVAAKVDSRTILDAMGADKLLGKGDMLYLPPGSAKLIRAQGALITDEEIQDMVDFIAEQGKPAYEQEIHQQLQRPASDFESSGKGGGGDGGNADDEIIERCIDVIRTEQKASVSLLQRRLRLGYTRAARIMDQLEDLGVVGPSKGAEPRDILIDLEGEGMDGGGQQLV